MARRFLRKAQANDSDVQNALDMSAVIDEKLPSDLVEAVEREFPAVWMTIMKAYRQEVLKDEEKMNAEDFAEFAEMAAKEVFMSSIMGEVLQTAKSKGYDLSKMIGNDKLIQAIDDFMNDQFAKGIYDKYDVIQDVIDNFIDTEEKRFKGEIDDADIYISDLPYTKEDKIILNKFNVNLGRVAQDLAQMDQFNPHMQGQTLSGEQALDLQGGGDSAMRRVMSNPNAEPEVVNMSGTNVGILHGTPPDPQGIVWLRVKSGTGENGGDFIPQDRYNEWASQNGFPPVFIACNANGLVNASGPVEITEYQTNQGDSQFTIQQG